MKVLIVGGGLTGISCAYALEQKKIDYVLIEKDGRAGGLCKSFNIDGFIFDYAGHFLHLKNKFVKSLILNNLENSFLLIKRNAGIYTRNAKEKDNIVPFPFQANLYYLKDHISRKCILDLLYINLEPNIYNRKEDSFYNWVLKNFGKSISKLFFIPYNSKIWKRNLKRIPINWAKYFIPTPDIEEILSNAFYNTTRSYGYNAYFYYPKYYGIQFLIDSLLNKINRNKVLLKTEVKSIDISNKKVKLSIGNEISYDKIINTSPLDKFLKLCQIKVNYDLRYVNVLCLNIALKKTTKVKFHWLYFPDKEYNFYRVGFYHNINKNLVPNNKGSIYVEISMNSNNINIKEVKGKVINDLIKTNIIEKKEDIIFIQDLIISPAYVVYEHNTEKNLKIIHRILEKNDIFSIGRYGAWKYSYMEENILDAFDAVNKISKNEC